MDVRKLLSGYLVFWVDVEVLLRGFYVFWVDVRVLLGFLGGC